MLIHSRLFYFFILSNDGFGVIHVGSNLWIITTNELDMEAVLVRMPAIGTINAFVT